MSSTLPHRRIIRLPYTHSTAGEYTPSNIVQGTPKAMTNNMHTDPFSGRFHTGVWASSPGKWSFEQTDSEEFCILVEGKARLTGIDGVSETFQAGDALIIPLGFKGTWETLEPLRKFYAVCERREEDTKTNDKQQLNSKL